jgi:hypothetical protein
MQGPGSGAVSMTESSVKNQKNFQTNRYQILQYKMIHGEKVSRIGGGEVEVEVG